SVYDFAGRASQAIHPDGSVVRVAPVQVKGLYPAAETSTLVIQNGQVVPHPFAFALGTPEATFADGNGNVSRAVLDQAGQMVLGTECGCAWTHVVRDEHNLVLETSDMRGNVTHFSYDAHGNLLSVSDAITDGSGQATLRTYTYDPIFNELTS